MGDQRDTLNDHENIVAIIESCERIIDYSAGMSKDEFMINGPIHDACAMNCIVIGERANKLSYEIKERYKGLDWSVIIRFRGRIAHTYGTVLYDLDFLWYTVFHDVPNIRNYCFGILDDINNKRFIAKKKPSSFFNKK